MKLLTLAALFLVAGCLTQAPESGVTTKELMITSPAFANNGTIPAQYTCQGRNVNPPLEIEGLPEGTVSLVLIVEDPDAPSGTWVHWVVWDIDPVNRIEENTVPGTEGMNDFQQHSYGGPCPPSGTHRYFFIVYALNTTLNLNSGAGKEDILKAIEGHILAKGVLIGLYGKV